MTEDPKKPLNTATVQQADTFSKATENDFSQENRLMSYVRVAVDKINTTVCIEVKIYVLS